MKKGFIITGIVGLFLMMGTVYANGFNHISKVNSAQNNTSKNYHHDETVKHQNENARYNCGVSGCNQTGYHTHNNETVNHQNENTHYNCGVSGCNQTGYHTHNDENVEHYNHHNKQQSGSNNHRHHSS